MVDEDWVEPSRRSLVFHGRPTINTKVRRLVKNLTEWIKERSLQHATLKNRDDSLATLSTSPGIALWLTVQAAGSLRDTIGRIFDLSSLFVVSLLYCWVYANVSVYIVR